MSTKTLRWLVGARDGKTLGSGEFYPNFIPTGPVPKFCPYLLQSFKRTKNQQQGAKEYEHDDEEVVGESFPGGYTEDNVKAHLVKTKVRR